MKPSKPPLISWEMMSYKIIWDALSPDLSPYGWNVRQLKPVASLTIKSRHRRHLAKNLHDLSVYIVVSQERQREPSLQQIAALTQNVRFTWLLIAISFQSIHLLCRLFYCNISTSSPTEFNNPYRHLESHLKWPKLCYYLHKYNSVFPLLSLTKAINNT